MFLLGPTKNMLFNTWWECLYCCPCMAAGVREKKPHPPPKITPGKSSTLEPLVAETKGREITWCSNSGPCCFLPAHLRCCVSITLASWTQWLRQGCHPTWGMHLLKNINCPPTSGGLPSPGACWESLPVSCYWKSCSLQSLSCLAPVWGLSSDPAVMRSHLGLSIDASLWHWRAFEIINHSCSSVPMHVFFSLSGKTWLHRIKDLCSQPLCALCLVHSVSPGGGDTWAETCAVHPAGKMGWDFFAGLKG